MNTKPYRQGDVLILPVTEIPAGLKQTRRVIFAFGEVTGHHHRIGTGAVGYADEPEAIVDYVDVGPGGADVTHEEHGTIHLPPGKYRNVIQKEYEPGALRNVLD
jgi:hypothetical protein